MSQVPAVRVVATHDFCCSYVPSSTSYGSLPGGDGLGQTVDRLRVEWPTVWADAGDFAAPVDGVLSYLPAGPVTEADVLRLYPWPDATLIGEMDGKEIEAVARSSWPEPWSAWGFNAMASAFPEPVVLAVLQGDAAEHVERVVGRRVGWRQTGVGLREAVAEALR